MERREPKEVPYNCYFCKFCYFKFQFKFTWFSSIFIKFINHFFSFFLFIYCFLFYQLSEWVCLKIFYSSSKPFYFPCTAKFISLRFNTFLIRILKLQLTIPEESHLIYTYGSGQGFQKMLKTEFPHTKLKESPIEASHLDLHPST